MSTSVDAGGGSGLGPAAAMDTSFFGHPRGLATLFFTEMWERFSYYGMRAILILYMVAPTSQGGLGFDTPHAASIYAFYTFAVYLMSMPGGWIADRFLGGRLAVLAGGIGIAVGNGMLAAGPVWLFYLGLLVIIAGTGMLKPNVSAMVGGLYSQLDPRRDSGFSIFYMGINTGAIIAPLACGYLAQKVFWRLGFIASSAVMVLGLVQFLYFRRTLASVGARPARVNTTSGHGPVEPLQREDWRRITAIAVLFVFSTVFWMSFEQAGSSLNLFADKMTHNSIFGFDFPSSWFQSVEPIVVVTFAPAFSWLWLAMGRRQPSSPAKFAYGLFSGALAFVIITYASTLTRGGLVGPVWLLLVYFFQGIGELLLGPVGLSTTTKLAPKKIAGLMMGVWFFSIATGNLLAGLIARSFTQSVDTLVLLFGSVALLTLLSVAVLAALTPFMRRLMGTVN